MKIVADPLTPDHTSHPSLTHTTFPPTPSYLSHHPPTNTNTHTHTHTYAYTQAEREPVQLAIYCGERKKGIFRTHRQDTHKHTHTLLPSQEAQERSNLYTTAYIHTHTHTHTHKKQDVVNFEQT